MDRTGERELQINILGDWHKEDRKAGGKYLERQAIRGTGVSQNWRVWNSRPLQQS